MFLSMSGGTCFCLCQAPPSLSADRPHAAPVPAAAGRRSHAAGLSLSLSLYLYLSLRRSWGARSISLARGWPQSCRTGGSWCACVFAYVHVCNQAGLCEESTCERAWVCVCVCGGRGGGACACVRACVASSLAPLLPQALLHPQPHSPTPPDSMFALVLPQVVIKPGPEAWLFERIKIHSVPANRDSRGALRSVEDPHQLWSPKPRLRQRGSKQSMIQS